MQKQQTVLWIIRRSFDIFGTRIRPIEGHEVLTNFSLSFEQTRADAAFSLRLIARSDLQQLKRGCVFTTVLPASSVITVNPLSRNQNPMGITIRLPFDH